MTRRQSIKILIRYAARGFVGDGCGIRSSLTEQERAELDAAIEIAWSDAYGFPLDDSARFNLGMPARRL